MTTDIEEDGELTHDTWAAALTNGVLLGESCPDCGHATAVPKAACVRCGNREMEAVQLPTVGTVYAETTIHVPPAAFEERSPYGVALIDVDEARIMAHLAAAVEIGDRVELRGVVEDDDSPGPLFGPVSADYAMCSPSLQ